MATRRSLLKKSKSKPAPSPKSVFDVIVTFHEREQVFLDPFTVPKGLPEAGFVQAVFAKLETEELAELVKISVCMHIVPGEDIESWIPTREGKFFFNAGVNVDEDTIRWAAQKNAELERRQKS